MASGPKRATIAAAIASIAIAGLVGCADDGGDPIVSSGPYETLAERPCPDGSFLHWENFGQPFIRDWCTGCHSTALVTDEERREAPIEVNLDSLDGVRENMDLMYLMAGNLNRMMPPAGGPGDEERELLAEWLACGAPTRLDLYTHE